MLNRWAKAKYLEIEAQLLYDAVREESALGKADAMAHVLEQDPKIAEWKCKAHVEAAAFNDEVATQERGMVRIVRRDYLRRKLAADHAWEKWEREKNENNRT